MLRFAAAAVAVHALLVVADAVPASADDDALPAPQRGDRCAFMNKIPGAYLDGWCQSLAPVGTEICGTLRNGTIVPSHWPYDTSKLEAAQAWCCAHVSIETTQTPAGAASSAV